MSSPPAPKRTEAHRIAPLFPGHGVSAALTTALPAEEGK